jgi:ABC-type polysaccharide/polyol phosphate transport system ATPase subunit
LSEPKVQFDRVWKKFHRGSIHDSLRDLIPDMARRLVGRSAPARELDQGDFWALRDLSFEVSPGKTLGIIGPNGSGKSTTLKILTRIMAPTRGRSLVTGRLGALIEIAAGFHGDLTGRENVFLQGAIMGMRSAEIAKRFDQIVEFSGVADAIDTPVKRYSSGMSARLGFAIAAHLEPEVLVIDEVLAVGDLQFQERAYGRLRTLARSGIPVIIVSHSLDRIAELCTEVILLTQGQVTAHGTADEAIGAYVRQYEKGLVTTSGGVIDFAPVRVLDGEAVESGQHCSVLVTGQVRGPIPPSVDPLFVRIRSLRTGAYVYGTGSNRFELPFSPGPFAVRLELQANLPASSYAIEVAAHDMQTGRDLAVAPPAVIRVTTTGDWAGWAQLNVAMRREPSDVTSVAV